MLQGTTYWTDLFVRHFLFQEPQHTIDSDDLLFFVRKKHIKGTSRHTPKFDVKIIDFFFIREFSKLLYNIIIVNMDLIFLDGSRCIQKRFTQTSNW